MPEIRAHTGGGQQGPLAARKARPVQRRDRRPGLLLRPAQPPWQRGSNENANGLLRQYFPRRTDFKAVTQSDLDEVAAELNDCPRQTLKWKSPCQALDEALR
jgi:hypothetical protein